MQRFKHVTASVLGAAIFFASSTPQWTQAQTADTATWVELQPAEEVAEEVAAVLPAGAEGELLLPAEPGTEGEPEKEQQSAPSPAVADSPTQSEGQGTDSVQTGQEPEQRTGAIAPYSEGGSQEEARGPEPEVQSLEAAQAPADVPASPPVEDLALLRRESPSLQEQLGGATDTAFARRIEQSDDPPVSVRADRLTYEQPSDTVTATGNVVVTRGDTTVTADTIGVNRTTNAVNAQGRVVVKDQRAEITAEALQFNIENETGEITKGTVHLPRNQYTLAGEALQKGQGQTYHITNGQFTTCRCDDFKEADWSIAAKKIDVTQGKSGKVRDGFFQVRGIPLLYLPYAVVPVEADRQTGLLAPHFGFSSKRGFQWQQPFYWALDRSQDVTITPDMETSARLGVLGEYRYAPNAQTHGEFLASYFNEQIRGSAARDDTPIDRWSITGTHQQRLANNVRLYSDLFFVSDDLFLREINVPFFPSASEADLRARRFTDSHVGALKTWDRALLRTEASYYQDLRQNQDSAFQVLPRMQFEGSQYLWHDRVEAGLAVEGANFYRNQGYRGQRFNISPSLSYPFHVGNYAFGGLTVIGHETVYHQTSDQRGFPVLPTSAQLDPTRTRETAQVQAQLGTRLARTFDIGWGHLAQIQHVIEPEVSFLYTPFVDQDDLPLYDAFDRINKRSLLVYGVANRVLGKFTLDTPAGGAKNEAGTQVRELARFTVTQGYDLSRELSANQKEQFSDLDLHAQLTPLPYTAFTLESVYDVGKGDMTAARVGAFLQDPRPLPETSPLLRQLQRQTTVGVTYQTITDRILKEVDAHVIFRLNEQITTAYSSRYNLNANEFIGNRYSLRYISPQQCWFIDLGVVDKVNPHEFEFRFLFTLVGLSSFGSPVF